MPEDGDSLMCQMRGKALEMGMMHAGAGTVCENQDGVGVNAVLQDRRHHALLVHRDLVMRALQQRGSV